MITELLIVYSWLILSHSRSQPTVAYSQPLADGYFTLPLQSIGALHPCSLLNIIKASCVAGTYSEVGGAAWQQQLVEEFIGHKALTTVKDYRTLAHYLL